jgi:uncharacterized protein (TIGR03382 family)
MRRLALLSLLFVALAPPAQAGDSWSTPYAGVRHLHRTTSSPTWNVHALVVDLNVAGVRLGVTPYSLKGHTTSSVASQLHAQAAVNGDFFNYSGYIPSGLTIAGAQRWPGTSDGTGEGTLQFDHGTTRVELTDPPTVVAPATWMDGVVSGHPTIVKNGAVPSLAGTFCTTRHPRTAVGLSADRRQLFIAVVDGRQSSSVGMTCTELGNLLKGLGAAQALNFDGGGSSTMWLSGPGVVNSPSDGSERVVSNQLLVFAGATPPPTQSGTLTGAVYKAPTTAQRLPGATVRLNTGQTAQADATGIYTFTLAPGSYTATATATGYVAASVTRTVTANQLIWGSIGLAAASGPVDTDADGIPDATDNCDAVQNRDQLDTDHDGLGDACDGDDDGDHVFDEDDDCPLVSNPSQLDTDHDGLGDACDADDDDDRVADAQDDCPLVANTDQLDTDHDGHGDACEGDDDADGVGDLVDLCPVTPDPDQLDTDHDGHGDACDADDDNDGALDADDDCPLVANADQADLDGDGQGDACDDDLDGDGVPNETDVCPAIADPAQTDADHDGRGDACEPPADPVDAGVPDAGTEIEPAPDAGPLSAPDAGTAPEGEPPAEEQGGAATGGCGAQTIPAGALAAFAMLVLRRRREGLPRHRP